MRLIMITLLVLLSNAMRAAELPTIETTSIHKPQTLILENGLKIIVKEDHRAPVVVSMVWYNVGAADEPGGITGVSHALEHLLFKGTQKNPLGVFAKKISALGGEFNAATSSDYTNFYEKTAAVHLATNLELEADRMQALLWDEIEFAKEINVIQEERRLRTDDNPQALAFERFLATAHLSMPYQHPVIGWMSDLKQMKMQDAKNWYQRYYAPNNATLVIVGDVQTQEAFKLAKHYFGALSSKPQIPRKMQMEPPQLGQKTVRILTKANLPTIILGYTVPSVSTAEHAEDPYALEIIAAILGAGNNGRFSRELEHEKQIASSTGVYYNLYARYETQFAMYGIPGRSRTLADLALAFRSELKRLQTTLVQPDELSRIKTQLIAQKTFEKDSIFTQATEIGLLETVGLGLQTAEDYLPKIKQITAEQIRKTAQQYFQPDQSTEAQLILQRDE